MAGGGGGGRCRRGKVEEQGGEAIRFVRFEMLTDRDLAIKASACMRGPEQSDTAACYYARTLRKLAFKTQVGETQ